MKRFIYSALFVMILFGGIFVGMFKGQEVRQKWVAKMKHRRDDDKKSVQAPEVSLDDFELAAYHS